MNALTRLAGFAALCFLALSFFAWAPPAAAMEITRVVSKGGIEAWLAEDHTIPVISLNLLFRGGAALDPAGKEGLAAMTAALIDEGAGDLDSAAFQQKLNDLAISLSFSASLDTFEGELKTLTRTRDTAFDLLRLALTQARFDDQPVERISHQILASLAVRAEDPDTIARRAWFRAAFPGHPYARPPEGTPAGVKAVTVADLRAFVPDRFGRDKLLIGVAGDITPRELAPLLDFTFGGLPARAAAYEIAETEVGAGGVIVIERDIPQSVVTFGHNGIKRDDPDFFAARLVNYVLAGGGFNSRLTEEVREKRGLAYSVYSYLAPYAHAARIAGGVGTANSRVGESLDIIRDEWRRLAAEGVTEEELKNAKSFLTGSFPLQFTSTARLARLMTTIQYFDLGIDYLDRRGEIINAVTLDDARRVADKFFHADDLLVVIVGTPEGVTPTRPAPPESGS